MTQRILRYEVPVDDQPHPITLSGAGTVLHVASRDTATVEFWAVHSGEAAPTVDRQFIVVGTGHSYPDHWIYVGTAFAAGGALVWHLMEVP